MAGGVIGLYEMRDQGPGRANTKWLQPPPETLARQRSKLQSAQVTSKIAEQDGWQHSNNLFTGSGQGSAL